MAGRMAARRRWRPIGSVTPAVGRSPRARLPGSPAPRGPWAGRPRASSRSGRRARRRAAACPGSQSRAPTGEVSRSRTPDPGWRAGRTGPKAVSSVNSEAGPKRSRIERRHRRCVDGQTATDGRDVTKDERQVAPGLPRSRGMQMSRSRVIDGEPWACAANPPMTMKSTPASTSRRMSSSGRNRGSLAHSATRDLRRFRRNSIIVRSSSMPTARRSAGVARRRLANCGPVDADAEAGHVPRGRTRTLRAGDRACRRAGRRGRARCARSTPGGCPTSRPAAAA